MKKGKRQRLEYAREIRRKLRHGDLKMIADKVECSVELVKKVFSGLTDHRIGKSKKVIETAEELIHKRSLKKN